jgi:hypothetical protein
LAASSPEVVPVPVRETFVVFSNSKAPSRPPLKYCNEMLPLTLPRDSGAKIVVRVTLCSECSVNGGIRPLMLNPAPDTVARKIVRSPLPVLFTTTDCDTSLPIGTLPKFTVEGLAVSCALAVAANRKIFKKTNAHATRIRGE